MGQRGHGDCDVKFRAGPGQFQVGRGHAQWRDGTALEVRKLLGWPLLDDGRPSNSLAQAKSYRVPIASERQFLEWLGKSVPEDQAKTYTSDQLASLSKLPKEIVDQLSMFGLIEAHIKSRGWYLAKGEPTDTERASYDKIASLSLGRGSRAARTPIDSPLGAWVSGALAQAAAHDGAASSLVRIRMMGGSVPTDKLVDALNVPFVITPLVNGDNNQHSYDENMRVGNYLDGVRAFTRLLRTPF